MQEARLKYGLEAPMAAVGEMQECQLTSMVDFGGVRWAWGIEWSEHA